MRIGIITFHWGTNYGAVLQAYALQSYLIKEGHDVIIIDYKPKKFNSNLFKIITSRSILKLEQSIKNLKKEKELARFRNQYLHLSKSYNSLKDLKTDPPKCDIYISGSDQVLNPTFTLYGEAGRKPASSYYLDFGDRLTRRIGYAVSFGITVYPEKAKQIAQPLLKNFDIIGVRENSGIDILKDMGYENTVLTPDPTLLLVNKDFDHLLNDYKQKQSNCFIYMLRNRKRVIKRLKQIFPVNIIADVDTEYSIQSWISNIKNAKIVITNSYHGVVFCLHYKVPFIVMLKSKRLTGMNDRFYTLLDSMNLTDRIIDETEYDEIDNLKYKEINWNNVDCELEIFKQKGVNFLSKFISAN